MNEPPSTSSVAPSSDELPKAGAATDAAVQSGEDSVSDAEEQRLVPSDNESTESEECDDSGDENFTPYSEADDSDIELQSQESASSEHGGEEDIGIYLMDGDLRSQVTEIINADACENRCVEGKAEELEYL
ncbi:hypothetical protein PI124_g17033 [Phytophthora idaei]|nr:hypothetical protein PI125_g3631 [Phytophthora idaei]KAG3237989.1 hypothetical protein PI124_g17033 [Phytophthora idaei]